MLLFLLHLNFLAIYSRERRHGKYMMYCLINAYANISDRLYENLLKWTYSDISFWLWYCPNNWQPLLLTTVLLLYIFKAGFGMLEAGSVRSKNTTNILTKNFGDLCLGVVAFCLVGYGLAFSEGNEWVGNKYFGLINLPYSLYPHVFMQVSDRFGLKESV